MIYKSLMANIRTRFAPSPTGPLHIGGVRTALFAYLFAKANHGEFILRIEDTDQARYVEGAEKYIISSLAWCGITFDEGPDQDGDYGPYRQSERKDIYAKYTKTLIENGSAYYAFDTPEELEDWRNKMKDEGVHTPRYDNSIRMQMRNSLTMSSDEVQKLLSDGVPYVVRLKVPKDEKVSFDDVIREEVTFDTNELDDKVLFKSDGMPTYHMANVIDDYSMKISHVIRGEEWLSSTGHHVLLYKAFGWEDSIPTFVHLPLILKPTGKGKLSKRDGAKFGFPVFPLSWDGDEEFVPGFDTYGFDPKAVINFLALLGWSSTDDQEIFSMEELVAVFSLDKIQKGGARFDFDKAKWFNQQYIIHSSNEKLATKILSLAAEKQIDLKGLDVARFCGALKERVTFYNDFLEDGYYFFSEVKEYDEKTIRKKWNDEAKGYLGSVRTILAAVADFDAENLSKEVKAYITENGISFGKVFPFLRIALSGTMQGPDLFEIMSILGQEIVLQRLHNGMIKFDEIKN